MVFINPNVTHNRVPKNKYLSSQYSRNYDTTIQPSFYLNGRKKYHLIHLKRLFICQMAMSKIKLVEKNEWI